MKRIFFLLVTVLILSACEKPEIETALPAVEKILHIAHTRVDEQGVIDSQLRDIPLSNYKMHLLGGDMDVFTSADAENMQNWDDLFNFSAPSTLWTLGNHDVSNRDLIEEFTERPPFYSYTANDISFLVLDTQSNSSNITGEQLALVQAVTDTLSESKHLIVLTHKLLWLQGNEEVASFLETIPNGEAGDCGYCTNPNNFYTDIYPKLVEVQNRGIKVWCIAGDIGNRVSEFSYTLPEGVLLLASGLRLTEAENKVLELERTVGEKEWTWQFKNIEEL